MKITLKNLENLETGSNFLGSGGGADLPYTKALALSQLQHKDIPLVAIDSLTPNDLIASITCLGCPTIEAEKGYNIFHLQELIKKIEDTYQQKVTAIAANSVGGRVLFLPLFLAGLLDLPIVDGDFFGRCFPEIQMLSTHIAGVYPKHAFFSNVKGHVFEIACNNFYDLEHYARSIAVASGGFCTAAPQVLTGEEAKKGMIAGTFTQALTIGKIIEETQNFDTLMDYTKGTLVGMGGIVSIEYLTNMEPFKIRIQIKNLQAQKTWEIFMENEFNLLLENGQCAMETPDIITLCSSETCVPLTFRQLHYGVNVAIVTMKAPDVFYTKTGLELTRSQHYLLGREKVCVSV